MHILSHATGEDWQTFEVKETSEGSDRSTIDKTAQLLADLLLSENLLVLCGLGSSMYLNDAAGKRIAPSMADLWEGAKEKAGEKFPAILAGTHYEIPDGQSGNIEELLSRCQMTLQLHNDTNIGIFVKETEEIIATKCRFPQYGVNSEFHESFLRKVARRSPRLPRTRVFTTNYDLCFEVAASRSKFILVDGFSHTFPQEFDGGYFNYDLVKREQDREAPDYITNVFHLYKVHGSVDWEKTGNSIIKNPSTTRPCLIYPRQGKYQSSYEQPFGEMMSRFQMALRQPNTGLLIIGFGFNDAHLVQPIMSAIRSNVSLRFMIVDPQVGPPEQDGETRIDEILDIEKLVKNGDTRMSLLSAKFEEFVPLIPDLVAQTEEEMHRQRIHRIEGKKQ